MSSSSTLKVIIVASASDVAKTIGNAVKKAGFSVKGKMAGGLDVLEAELQKQPWDVVLAAEQLPDSMTLTQVVDMTNQHQANTPVVVVSKQADENIRYEALLAEARDAVSIQHPQLLAYILRPEKPQAPLEEVVEEAAGEVSGEDIVAVAEAAPAEEVPQRVAPKQDVPVAVPVGPESLSAEESEWYERTQKALENDQFVCAYQPIVNLNAEPASNYELLLRMLDENGKEIPPGAFLGAAEKTGLITEIDRWVIAHAIKTIKTKLEEDASTRFFIKLSTPTLQDGKLIRWLSEQLHSAQLPDHTLAFEITADAASQNEQRVKSLITAIRMNKCLICLDRVSDTESHKRLVVALGVDCLKISGQLIHELATNKDNQFAVDSISRYAKANKVFTIAQFVQDPSSLAFLWQKGINYIQGYYLQRPDSVLNYKFDQDEEEVEAPSV